MSHLQVENLAQIANVDIQFGDLTLLVGPQASGKSVFLQLFKLVQDHGPITATLRKYGYWYERTSKEDASDPLLTLMFGEGMGGIWRNNSVVKTAGQRVELESLRKANGKDKESVFFVPAQRMLTLDQGRLRNFDSFAALDPFVVKNFSEHLRQWVEQRLTGQNSQLFPVTSHLKEVLRDRISESIFHGATITQQLYDLRKRIVISLDDTTVPFMAWSAGQREFMPLLFSLYWLMPTTDASRRSDVDWVVIEEPEMGLHPMAIQSVLLSCLDLMHRGYKVVISTHSPLLLEAAWVMRTLQEQGGAADALFELFDLPVSPGMCEVFDAVLSAKELKSYYFQPSTAGVSSRDISSLNPFSENESVSDWGGITQFSSRASEVISRLMQGHWL